MKKQPPGVLRGDGWMFISLLGISASTFLFEITLTRLFAIAHFYHFAFMVVSLALLGGGASGSFLSLFPVLKRDDLRCHLAWFCTGCGLAILGGYLLFNHMPFDAYAIAIDPKQIVVAITQFLVLSAPFFFTGLCVNRLLKVYPQNGNHIYGVNLVGSALGCLLAPLLLPALGGEGVICVCVALAALVGLYLFFSSIVNTRMHLNTGFVKFGICAVVCVGLLLTSLPEVINRLQGESGNPLYDLHLSPYKSLSYALQYPGAIISDSTWNAFSRVDVVRSEGIRSLPGLSYLYPGLVRADSGLFVDGDNLSPVLPLDVKADYFGYLPQSLAYSLRPAANVLILEPRGGVDLLAAQAGGAASICAVEPNPLLVAEAERIYGLPNTTLWMESPRSFLSHAEGTYDVIVYSLTSAYHPVTSGAYSLGEDYKYTQESIRAALAHLQPDGMLVISRWLQVPPSEFLRAFILVVEALDDVGLDPQQQIVAIRGYNLGTLFVKNTSFTDDELDEVRTFAKSHAFDLVYLPGIRSGEHNRFNILPEDDYHSTFSAYLTTEDRQAWLDAYPYDISPPSDNQPFFDHFFKWSQINQVLRMYGKTWQPFGGAGYLVVIFLFVVVFVLSLALILLPIFIQQLQGKMHAQKILRSPLSGHALLYFLLLGFGFMAIEMPLMQKFILFLGQPTYSFSAVLFTLLIASGLGSLHSRKVRGEWLLGLGAAICLSPLWLTTIIQTAMGWPLTWRLLIVLVCLTPPGFLMGIAFPKGISAVQRSNPNLIPWLWAVNGTSSVLATVLAAMLSISFGFVPLLVFGGSCYLLSYLFLNKMG